MSIFNDDGTISTISVLQSRYSDVNDQSHQNLSQSLSYHYVDPEDEDDEQFCDYDNEDLAVDSDWFSGFGKFIKNTSKKQARKTAKKQARKTAKKQAKTVAKKQLKKEIGKYGFIRRKS